MKVKSILIWIIVVLTSLYSRLYAQDQIRIDSLKKLLSTHPGDSVEAELLNDLASEYHKVDFKVSEEYAKGALERSIRIHSQKLKGRSYISLGNIHYLQGKFPDALEYYLKSLNVFEGLKDQKGISTSLLGVGNVYFIQKNFSKAIEYQERALNLRREMNDAGGMSGCYTNIGNIYFELGEYQKALDYHFKSLEIKEELKDIKGLSSSLGNIGNNYYELKRYDLALEYQAKALELRRSLGNRAGIIASYINMANIFDKQGLYSKAIKYHKNALDSSLKMGYKEGIKSSYSGLASSYSNNKDFQNAFKYFKAYAELKDSMLDESSLRQIAEMNAKYETEKKEKEIAILEKDDEIQMLAMERKEAEVEKQKGFILFFVVALILLVILALVLYNRYNFKRRVNVKLKSAYYEIGEKNKDITDSIQYAKRIQETLLTQETQLAASFYDFFILYKPKAIVSGDFFWGVKTERYDYIAAVDCTGHGVPGAFLSIIGHNFLNRAVNELKIEDPAEILDFLNNEISQTFKTKAGDEDLKDGMDISLCRFDFKNYKIHFAGANNPVVMLRDQEIIELKPDKITIGNNYQTGFKFQTKEIEIRKHDNLYLFTDGYGDQFGGPHGKKFKSARLRELLKDIASKPMKEQKITLDSALSKWKDKAEQVDDVLVIGIKIC